MNSLRFRSKPGFSLHPWYGSAAAVLLIAVCVLLGQASGALADEAELWKALGMPGHIGLMRHALAPGTGDPAEFKLDNCATQRNLSDQGRAQARRIGKRLKAYGIAKARVYSSQWCRCLETAELLDLGPVKQLPVINSFFRNFEREESQTRQLREWIKLQNLSLAVLLITHQVNITALTGIFPASGELLILRRLPGGEVNVLGSIRTS